MEDNPTLWQFIVQQSDKIWQQTVTHLSLTFTALLIAIAIGLPLGILIARKQKLAGPVLAFVGVLQTIPSIALLGFLIPLLGIGMVPAIVVLFLYALLPIVRNAYTGIIQVDETIKEAAAALGMSGWQRLWKVELPLAFPVIMAGIRTAAVINVGVATLAAYIAAGGLGEFIFGGIALNNTNMILAGAIPAALLAISLDAVFYGIQHIRIKRNKQVLAVVPVVLILLFSLAYIPFRSGAGLLAGFEPEFMGRQDGYLGLKSVYKLKIRTVVISDAIMYKAASEHKLDVIGGYSTDGRLKAYNLAVLDDDRHIFPPYYAAPVIRADVLQQHPVLEKVLNLLAGKINDSTMIALNYKVDYLKQPPEKVAKDFLIQQQLYKAPQQQKNGVIRIGSKVFSEQYILADLYASLIDGYTSLKPETKTGLGGTKICFDALTHNQIDFYPEYTGTGFLVLLHPAKDVIKKISSDRNRVFNYVKQQFAEQYKLTWLQPLGFNNTYALMMRTKQANDLRITNISQLSHYVDKNK